MASTIPVEDVSNTDAGSSSTPVFTIETLKEHSTRESLYMLLHDKVYDVTAFMDEHPGGDEVLVEEAGRDATEAFEDVGHSDEARAMLPKMLLGDFKGEKKTKKSKVDPVTGVQSSSKSSSLFLPIAIIGAVGAFLFWRFVYA